MPVCARCGKKEGMFTATGRLVGNDYLCQVCSAGAGSQQDADALAEDKRQGQLRQAATKVVLTTTQSIDGYFVKRYVGIESIEYVIGTGLFSEVTSELADFFGARSSAFEKKLQAAKLAAMFALKYRATEQGANAVLAIDLDYTEFSGNRVALILNGTLVEIAPRVPKGG